jgi:hypothetical protein
MNVAFGGVNVKTYGDNGEKFLRQTVQLNFQKLADSNKLRGRRMRSCEMKQDYKSPKRMKNHDITSLHKRMWVCFVNFDPQALPLTF